MGHEEDQAVGMTHRDGDLAFAVARQLMGSQLRQQAQIRQTARGPQLGYTPHEHPPLLSPVGT